MKEAKGVFSRRRGSVGYSVAMNKREKPLILQQEEPGLPACEEKSSQSGWANAWLRLRLAAVVGIEYARGKVFS